mgnify:CR=1 FL=1
MLRRVLEISHPLYLEEFLQQGLSQERQPILKMVEDGTITAEQAAELMKAMGVEEDRINIKATTEEGLGFTGRGEGIASQAICLLEEV